MNDSSKKLKKNKLPSYLAIGAVAAGSTLGAFNEANAGNTIKTTTAIISEANISDAQANDIVIAPTDITASVQTLAFNVATVSDIIMGINDSTVQTVTLNVAPAAAAVTIAANIVAVGDSDNDVTKLIVSSSVANSSQLVTFNGKIGPGVITGDGALADTNDENDIDSIEVGSATTAAQALFNEHTVTDLLTVFGGNQSNENNVATFAKVLNSTAGIVLNDSGTAQTAKIVFSSSATADILGSINGGAADEGIMQITGANKTFDGAIGDTQKIGLIDIDESTNMNAAVIATAVTVADGKTAQFDVALTTTTIDLANTGILKTIGTSTIAGNVTGGTINSSTAVQTYSGTIGTALKKTNINADFGTIFNGVVNATTISVADGKTVDFDLSVTADTITLGSSTAGSSVSFTGGTLKTVTGDLVSFNTDEKGTVISNGTADVIFAGNLGTAARSLLLLTATDDTTTNQDVFVKGLTNANGKDLNMKGNVEIGTNDAVLTGTTSDLLLSGTVAQTITATAAGSVIKGAGNGQGIVKVSNAAGATLDIVLGTGARLLNLTTSGTGHVILNKTGNLVDKLTWGATSVVEISTSMVQDATIFTTNAIGNGIAVGATIVMPSDLAADSTITLITNVGATTNVDNTVTRVNAAVKDTALVDYVATKTGTQVVNVTANEKSAAAIATSLGASKNEATAFRQVRNAMVGSGSVTDLSTINGVLNERDGFTISDDTLLAKQAAPQTDSIGGSSIATRAMTGTVQGIVSNRMASLRSGDAFVTGMSAGNGMSANSGFIQAFGSEGEQKKYFSCWSYSFWI